MPTALITGAAKRVGKVIALRLAQEGYDIIVHYGKSQQEAEETAEEIRRKGVNAYIKSADLTKLEEVDELVEYSLQHCKTIDVLVNNAATFYKNPLKDLDTAERFRDAMNKSLDSNLIGPLYLSRKIGYHMKNTKTQQNPGVIVMIGDHAQAMDRYYRDYLPYNISKGALGTATKALAVELAPEVRVNMVANGPIEPPEDMTVEEREEVARKNLLRRWGGAKSTAESVVFCIKNDFLTGAVIPNNGGAHLLY